MAPSLLGLRFNMKGVYRTSHEHVRPPETPEDPPTRQLAEALFTERRAVNAALERLLASPDADDPIELLDELEQSIIPQRNETEALLRKLYARLERSVLPDSVLGSSILVPGSGSPMTSERRAYIKGKHEVKPDDAPGKIIMHPEAGAKERAIACWITWDDTELWIQWRPADPKQPINKRERYFFGCSTLDEQRKPTTPVWQQRGMEGYGGFVHISLNTIGIDPNREKLILTFQARTLEEKGWWD